MASNSENENILSNGKRLTKKLKENGNEIEKSMENAQLKGDGDVKRPFRSRRYRKPRNRQNSRQPEQENLDEPKGLPMAQSKSIQNETITGVNGQRIYKNHPPKDDQGKRGSIFNENGYQKEEKPWGNRGRRRPNNRNNQNQQQFRRSNYREEKRQIPDENLVSSVRPKGNLVKFQSPPYTILPPRDCNLNRMTVLKLKNLDSGVDESLLFWAFKPFGWIENIYVVRDSFRNGQPGVAFIGFRFDKDAGQTEAKSGNVQLFGRRVYIYQYYIRRNKTHVFALDSKLLERIFSDLDYRSRLRCERVCKKFKSILKDMGEANRRAPNYHPWIGLPSNIGFAFLNKKQENGIVITGQVFKVGVSNADFHTILSNILRKFSPMINRLEFYRLSFNAETLSILESAGRHIVAVTAPMWNAGEMVVKGVMLNDVGLERIMEFMQFYGDNISMTD